MMSDSNNKASLGCGSLILIALIVMFFSRSSGYEDMERELAKLQIQVQNLRDSIEQLDRQGELSLSTDELKSALDTAAAESERRQITVLLPKYREIYARLLPEDPFKDGDPKTLDELLAPLREIVAARSVETP